MKTQLLIVITITLFFPLMVPSQVGINIDKSSPDPSSILDVKSSDKGALFPRLSTTQRDAISSPAIGLVIYNTTNKCHEVWTGSKWFSMCDRSCGAWVATGVWKSFHCYNLGSYSTLVDPFIPQWQNHGGYYQWGRLPNCGNCWGVTDNNAYYISGGSSGDIVGAAGPSSGVSGGENSGSVSGWYTTYAPNGSWSDVTRTPNDPCPGGYRVPTKTNWDGIAISNSITRTGSWSNSNTNYTTAIKFGSQLVLPASGYRNYSNGTLSVRGSWGIYWSSTEFSTTNAWSLSFDSSSADASYILLRTQGQSVRCIGE